MYTNIYQNSYIMSFIFLCLMLAIFYFFQINSSVEITSDGQIIKKFNWKLPVALTLIFWVVWHYILFPPITTNTQPINNTPVKNETKIKVKPVNKGMAEGINEIINEGMKCDFKEQPKFDQNFNMSNWI